MITLVDTSELKRPTQRKLHAAWRELQGERVLASPGVADELAPLAANVLWREGPSEPSTPCRAARCPKDADGSSSNSLVGAHVG